jgi:DNA-binding CsgD family transcriptional regulator
MQELRFVAVSEDGRYAVLAVPGRSARFTLPIDERLRAVALGQTSRLTQYEIEVESPLRPKEIQARIRAGETVEEIADAAGISVERVRWFEAPILAERAYAADQAQLASVRRQGDATPGPRLGEIVTERLKVFGADPEDAQWDAKKLGDGSWQVQLTFISGERLHTAEWMFDPRRRHVLPTDDNAARMSLPGTEPPQPAAPPPGEATVTHLAPRLSSAAGSATGHGAPVHSAPIHSAPGHAAPGHAGPAHAPGFGQPGTDTTGFGSGTPGNSAMGGNGAIAGNGGRARHERPGPARSAIPQPHVAEPQVAEPQVAEPHVADRQLVEPQVAQPHVADRQLVEPEAPESREAEAPAVVAPSVPSAPAVSPATVAAQAARAGQGPQPGRTSSSAGVPQPGRMAQPGRASLAAQASQPAQDARTAEEARVAQARKAAAAASSSAVDSPAAAAPAASSPSPAEAAPSAHPASAEPASEQAARQGRKAARGKRSSVPSWDEIMFGSSRQRD